MSLELDRPFSLIIEGPSNANLCDSNDEDGDTMVPLNAIDAICVITQTPAGNKLLIRKALNLNGEINVELAIPSVERVIEAAKLHDWALENSMVFEGIVSYNEPLPPDEAPE